jgi:hypothetical protein
VHDATAEMRLAAALALVAGCHAPVYRPEHWAPGPDVRASVGCLDVDARVMADGVGKVPGIPLWISFHNACKEAVLVDLRLVRVTGHLGDAGWETLAVYDPDHAMRTGLLAPGDVGEELLEYDPPGAWDGAFSTVCVDFGRVRPDRDVRGGGRTVVCVDRPGRAVPPDAPEPAPDGAWP